MCPRGWLRSGVPGLKWNLEPKDLVVHRGISNEVQLRAVRQKPAGLRTSTYVAFISQVLSCKAGALLAPKLGTELIEYRAGFRRPEPGLPELEGLSFAKRALAARGTMPVRNISSGSKAMLVLSQYPLNGDLLAPKARRCPL